ncbi:hypothetical protein ABZ307_28475 [Streptomyces griseorubiginosus]|uniref:hypothetical protein n=1 Tax=Streptomyces griseorubiginosus TaxID=67304 RepID=UPI0033BF9723
MGYKRAKTYHLVFDANSGLEGLEIEVTGISVGRALEVYKLQDRLKEGSPETVTEVLRIFADHLKRWNVEEDDGTAVETTFDELVQQDIGFVLEVISRWMEAVASVSTELGKDSNSGGTSQEERLPMEELS